MDDLTSSDVIVNEGEDATLVCRASGHPEPQILWLREDKKEFVVYSTINNHTRRETGSTKWNLNCVYMQITLAKKTF